jgi:hypothetical protein
MKPTGHNFIKEIVTPVALAAALAIAGVVLAGCDNSNADGQQPVGTENGQTATPAITQEQPGTQIENEQPAPPDAGVEDSTVGQADGSHEMPGGAGEQVSVPEGWPTPESFVDFVKNWGYEKVVPRGIHTDEFLPGAYYVYECTYENGEVVWSTVHLDENGNKVGSIYDEKPDSTELD